MSVILGISAFYHDSAAALLVDGKLMAAAQEERFTRIKHSSGFPFHAIDFCLKYSNLKPEEIDAIVFYDKPMLRFERTYKTFMGGIPRGMKHFYSFFVNWVLGNEFPVRSLKKNLISIGFPLGEKQKLLYCEHHLSHAASAFYTSGFKSSAILIIDGVGEKSTVSIGVGKDKSITILKELNYPHSVGLLYSAFTDFLGFRVNSGEYKMMGLAPFGNPDDPETHFFIKQIKEILIEIKADGSIALNQNYFNYALGETLIHKKKWERLFKLTKRVKEAKIEQSHCNLAYAIQSITEEIIVKLAKTTLEITGEENLCMAGGVAFNCVANGKLLREKVFKNIFIQPASDDAGGALGAALAIEKMYYQSNDKYDAETHKTSNSFLGPEFTNEEIELFSRSIGAKYVKYDSIDELVEVVAQRIAEGKVVGWFQGRMEFGARALGNRSILADARIEGMQKILNEKIKQRENFRPFAPSVLQEDRSVFFDLESDSPYMMRVGKVNKNFVKDLPTHFSTLNYMDKLYLNRSEIQAITHVDGSARVQTVSSDFNPRFYKLLKAFKSISGIGLLVNTSFNVRGELIVCSPQDAYYCFMRTEMDILVINDYVFLKEDNLHVLVNSIK